MTTPRTHPDAPAAPVSPASSQGSLIAGPARRLPFYYGWLIVLVSALGMFATAPGQTFTVAVFVDPIGATLGLSKTEVSTAYTIAGSLAALAVLQVGRAIDRFGIRRSAICIGIAFGLVCLGMSQVQGMATLAIGFAALRIAGPGALSLASTVLPTRWFVRRRGLALGLVALGMGLSHAVMPTATQHLIDAFGWRHAWMGLALLVWLLVLVPAIFLTRERPEALGLRADGDAPSDRHTAHRPAETRLDWTLGQAARTSSFWILMGAGITQSLVGTGIIFHQVSFFAEQGLIDRIALVFAVFAVAQTSSMTLTGVLLDRIPPRVALVGLQVLLIGSIALMPVLAAMPLLLPAYAALMGVSMGGMNTFGNVVWPTFFGTRHLATIRSVDSGIKMTAAAFGPLPLALAFDYLGGYVPGLVLFGLMTAVSAALGLACRPPRREQVRP